ncbi:EF-hand domain-containing protein [Nonomuraea sp. NPDC048882]|uniref:EF-hand domain-containing protein n=1 Tax=unclassified Nonomuraea TaxID=2593643 RepID=UPI0033D49689
MSFSAADRLRMRFELLDVNGSGSLTSADFELFAARVCRVLGVPTGAPAAHALAEGCRRFWTGLAAAADLDQDGQVTFTEYRSFSHDDAWFAEYGEAYVGAVSTVCDLDDDGLIERDHFLGLHSAGGFPLSYSVKLFDDLDGGGTGRVSTAAFAAFLRAYYTGADALL